MTNHNPFVQAARSLASDGLDVLFGALGRCSIKEQAGLPARPSTSRPPPSFRFVVTEVVEATGSAAQWNHDGTLALLTIAHAGRNWRVLARDHTSIVELLVPTSLRFASGQVPEELSEYLLTRVVPFGGYALNPDEGRLALHCRAMVPADGLSSELLHVAIGHLLTEIADLYVRLRL